MSPAPLSQTAEDYLKEIYKLEHERYKGVLLTSAGEKAAIEVIRHHRLLEQYLSETLGMPIDELHAEADRLEHALSEELEARIDESLGYPTHDPHGDPIPDANLKLPAGSERALADLAQGERATVSRVPDVDTELLRYLSSLSLLPGADVKLVTSAPFGGPVTVLSGGSEHAIARELALQIGVR